MPLATVPHTLISLPPEIHLHIFSYLGPVTATCFGLTNKKLYPLYKSLYRRVEFGQWKIVEGDTCRYVELGYLLEYWAARADFARGGLSFGGESRGMASNGDQK